ncbi:MAG: caspase domain-containing protein, partial [Rhizobiaceae bacterium]
MLRIAAALAAMICLVVSVNAAEPRRVALVLGNSDYAVLPPLPNAASDGQAISKRLQAMGFEVVDGFDLTKTETQATMARFAKVVRGADLALFFYAGHGLQVSERNYLLPVDALLEDETSLDFEAVSLDFVLRQLSRETKVRLVFLDACRDNPLAARGKAAFSDAGSGLAEVQFQDGGSGTLIAFATSPNQAAYDGNGPNSPFAAALLDHLGDENVPLTTVMTRVTGDVFKATAGKQRPWVNASLTDDVILNPVTEATPLIVGAAEDPQVGAGDAARGVPEPATPTDQVAINALRAQIPKLGSDGPILFDKPFDFGDPELD